MKSISIIFSIVFILLLTSCSKDVKKKSLIKENQLELQVAEAYQEGMKALKEGDIFFAATKFNEVEALFPQSVWAPKSALMAAYSYYSQDYYSDAIAELKRFIRIYPKHKDLGYVYYMLGISYFEQIVDEKKDTSAMLKSKEYFNIVLRDFKNTDYALDAEFKLDLIEDTLASKEMYLGRYYVNKKKWVAAINRFKTVIDDYDTTIYIEEALHRMVEIHYKLGLKDEAEKYAKLLGYNYKSSRWYENSYIVFNKKYEKNNIKKSKIKNKKISGKFLKKFKSLFN
mgnify:CR=1 FL=1|tara:strand:+ start:827 stop:1678 length:852 start_codon:yes stop_codon:yes gene_type:complete